MTAAVATLLVLLAVLVTGIAAHEVAHFLAARAVGHEVFEVQIGAGPGWSTRVSDIDVTVGLVPIGGHVQTGARHDAGFRWRSAVVAGGGVLANVALVVVGLAAGWPPVVAFNALAVAANLWPGGARQLGRPSSDGRTLVDLARGDRDAIAEERSAWFCVHAGRARESGDLDRARALVEEGTAVVGPTRALWAMGGMVAFEQRRFTDVVRSYAHLIDDHRVTVSGRAGFAADAAWSASLSEDPDLRRLAEPWAAFARRVRPRASRRRIVHGLALVDAGRPHDALEATVGIDDPAADAVRVLAAFAGGDVVAAHDLYEQRVATGLAPGHPLRDRVEKELGIDAR